MRYFTNIYANNYPMLAWSIIGYCNMKCPYCAAGMHKYQNYRMASRTVLDATCKAISSFNDNIEIELLGGEPTLHPLLPIFLRSLTSLDNVTNVGILTNALAYRKVPNMGKVWALCTYHPYKRYLTKYIDNISRYIDDGITVILTLTYRKKYHDEYMAIKEFARSNGITFDPTYICENNEVDIPEDVGNKIFILDGEFMSQAHVFRNKLNKFKGWSCNQRMLRMDIDGNVSTACQPNIGVISAGALKPRPITCKHDYCILDEQIEDPKWIL